MGMGSVLEKHFKSQRSHAVSLGAAVSEVVGGHTRQPASGRRDFRLPSSNL